MTKPFEFFFEMQHSALEIGDHRITSRTMDQSIRNFFFKRFLTPFKKRNVIWFSHLFNEPALKEGRSRDKGQRLLIFRG